MPDTRVKRGPHPKDAQAFAESALPHLEAAVEDLSWLLTRGYPKKASLALVGNRYGLRDRQRKAVQRCAAGDEECRERELRQVHAPALSGATLAVDGYNVLLTLEAALSGGVLLLARDGVLRDLTAMSAHYRRVDTTVPALERVAGFCQECACTRLLWYFDRPVSNSGRLKKLIEEMAAERDWPWEVRLVASPDRALIQSRHIVASADSGILDRCGLWFNLAREVVAATIAEAWIIDFRGEPEPHRE